MSKPSTSYADLDLMLLARLARRLPPGLGLLSDVATNRAASLYPAERDCIAKAVEARRDEFSTGRWLARRALRELGLPDQPIPPGPGREPLWPNGVVGSLTHSASVCGVAFASADDFQGIGLDLEVSRLPRATLAELILSPSEPTEYRSPEILRLVFSAKESVYKCVYPLCHVFLDFHDIDVRIDRDHCVFSAMSRHPAGVMVKLGSGLFEVSPRGAASLFVIPSASGA